jgi:hypothetical protein
MITTQKENLSHYFLKKKLFGDKKKNPDYDTKTCTGSLSVLHNTFRRELACTATETHFSCQAIQKNCFAMSMSTAITFYNPKLQEKAGQLTLLLMSKL